MMTDDREQLAARYLEIIKVAYGFLLASKMPEKMTFNGWDGNNLLAEMDDVITEARED